jgi:hypothetical protein
MSRQHRGALRAALSRVAVAAGAALALSLGAVPALAAPAAPAAPALPAGCTSPATGTVTCTYTAAGEHRFTVPPGVRAVTATAVGGQGGTEVGQEGPGGLGAVAAGTLSVTPGQALFAEVGILGGAAGELFQGFTDSGAGGGESDVRACSSAGSQPCAAGSTLASRLLVAAGGGGRGDFGGPGGNAGTTGSGGNGATGATGANNAGGGSGATSATAGAGGAGCDGGDDGGAGATAGGAGGDAGAANGVDGVSGGGGGGGWFGGGAGGSCSEPNDDGGSGGGGSSHAAASVTGPSFTQAAAGQAASVTISYTVLTIATAALPGATVGAAYSAQLTAGAGTEPLTWSLAAGSAPLPAGLTLSSTGAISGTPTTAGDGSVTIQVTDSSSPPQTATAAFTLDVAKASPHLSLAVAPPSNGPTDVDPVTLTATVTAAGPAPAPTGTVVFTVDGSTPAGCGAVPVSGLQAACTITSLAPGLHVLVASYGGDGNYTVDTQTISGYGVRKASAGISLTVSPPSGATVATPVTLTLAVSAPAGGPAPTGTVEFSVDGTDIAGCGAVALTGGAATCPVGRLSPGTHTIQAGYSGDATYVASSEAQGGYTVTQVASQVTVTPSVAAPVTGQGVSFTATVTAGGQPVVGGTVQWSVDGTATGAPVPVAADGTATLGPLTTLAIGSHKITAAYSGSAQDTAATTTITITVGRAATTTTISLVNHLLTATVASVPPGTGTPTGTVTFVVQGVGTFRARVGANGVATADVAIILAVNVTATYSGDTQFTGSASTVRLSPPPPLTASAGVAAGRVADLGRSLGPSAVRG